MVAGLLLLGLTAVSMAAPTGDPWLPFRAVWFDNLTVADGLPHSTVTALAQDSRGMIWLGTFGGLVRYDGTQLKVFGEQSDAADGLPDAYIRALEPLPHGDLLIGTNAGGLVIFDASTNGFRRFPIGQGGTVDGKIFALASDHANGWWIVTDNGMDHLDLPSGRIERVPDGPGSRADFPARAFSAMQDEQGDLWVGSNGGLFRRSQGSTRFEAVHASDPRIEHILRGHIWSIFADRDGRTWFGSQQAGSVYLDAAGNWHWVDGVSGPASVIGRRTVRDILQAQNGDLWFASDGAGVAVYSPADGTTHVLAHDASIPSTLPGNVARALLKDRAGNLWVATELGAARNDPKAGNVITVPGSPLQDHALADPDVHCIFVDSRGRIWLGLGMGRIDVIDLAAGRMHHLKLPADQAERDVQGFAMAPDGSIWVGAQGLARVDPQTFTIQGGLVPALENELVLSMAGDGDHILVGTYDGLFRVNANTADIAAHWHDPADATSVSGDEVRYISRMPGQWWFSTIAGISIQTDGEPGFRNLRHDGRDPRSLPQNYIGTTALDSRHRLWVATYGGLAYLDPFVALGPYRFKHLGMAEGLSSSKINAVLVDRHDRIWVSMAHGLAVIDPDTLKVSNLSTRDGLRVPSYVHRSASMGPNGELMFGGLGGLTVVLPDQQPIADSESRLTVTGVMEDGRDMPYGRLPDDGGSVALTSVSHSVRVNFALLDYSVAGETRYAYRLDGFDADWVDVPHGTPASAVYTNLPGGTYALRLRAETFGARPRTIQSTVNLRVPLRWYESAWARVFLAVLLLLAMVGLVWLRTQFLRRRAEQLQMQVDARTRDLQDANVRLDQLAGTDELTGAYNRRRFLDLAGQAVERAHASGEPLSLVLLDLDDFKIVNDTYGHLAGDAVIRSVMALTSSLCQGHELVGRYGGEELILGLPGYAADAAWSLTERIRKAVAQSSVVDGDHEIMITASAGIAVLQPAESLHGLLRRADDALYGAKHAGRNRSELV